MGNDGGSIPTRRELVKEAAKALTTQQVKEVRQESQEHAWNHDPLSSKPLSSPVVSDSAGILYNKDSIIEFLLAEVKDAEQEKVLGGRVKGLKDVVEVKFEADDGEVKSTGARREKWVCPVTREEMGMNAKAVYLVPCGHAFAGSVVREVGERICVQCNEAYAENDVIPILPTTPADIARLNLRAKTLKEKGLTHALKKAPGSKKRKKNATEATTDDADAAAKASTSEEDKKKKAESKKANASAENGIKNASTAYLTKRVLEEQQERNKRRKMEQNENVKSLFSKGSGGQPAVGNSADYMTRGFSIGKK